MSEIRIVRREERVLKGGLRIEGRCFVSSHGGEKEDGKRSFMYEVWGWRASHWKAILEFRAWSCVGRCGRPRPPSLVGRCSLDWDREAIWTMVPFGFV